MKFEKPQRAFWGRLGLLMRRGVPLRDALDGIIEDTAPGEWRMVLEALRDALAEGRSLAAALSAQQEVFGETLVAMVRIAEQHGRLRHAIDAAPWFVGRSGAVGVEEMMELLRQMTCAPESPSALLELAGAFGLAQAPAQAQAASEKSPGTKEPIPPVALVETVVQEAAEARASDVHIEPAAGEVRVRYRIDGVLQTRRVLGKGAGEELVARLRKMAGINGNSPRAADGRARVEVEGRTLTARVSVVPVHHGERVVLRLMGEESEPRDLAALGLGAESLPCVRDWTERSAGLILVTGPSGCGKTATLYALLRHAAREGRSVLTVEDPVEVVLEGVSQIPVDLKQGLNLAAAIKHALRQDPDVLMVGEVRDLETAQLAVQGALTGHLVLTALHAATATAALRRMADVGVAAWILRDTVVGVIGQRLVRRTCEACRAPHRPSKAVRDEVLRLTGQKNGGYVAGRGCPECAGTGYRGRTGVFEVLEPDRELWRLVEAGAPDAEMHTSAIARGLTSLRAAGFRRALAGETTPEEVIRVTA